MEIAPIPNLISMRVATPAAAPADLPTARAIDFRRQDEQEDATYTPGGREEEDQPEQSQQDEEQQAGSEMLETVPDTLSDEQPPQSTISVFA
jgi:hypothetical protein